MPSRLFLLPFLKVGLSELLLEPRLEFEFEFEFVTKLYDLSSFGKSLFRGYGGWGKKDPVCCDTGVP